MVYHANDFELNFYFYLEGLNENITLFHQLKIDNAEINNFTKFKES